MSNSGYCGILSQRGISCFRSQCFTDCEVHPHISAITDGRFFSSRYCFLSQSASGVTRCVRPVASRSKRDRIYMHTCTGPKTPASGMSAWCPVTAGIVSPAGRLASWKSGHGLASASCPIRPLNRRGTSCTHQLCWPCRRVRTASIRSKWAALSQKPITSLHIYSPTHRSRSDSSPSSQSPAAFRS